jgi:small ligand-binding sensory domain FIST
MIQAATGLSTLSHSVQAAVEVSRQARADLEGSTPDWCVAFVTAHHESSLPALLGALSENLGTPYVVGCSAAGVLARGEEIESGPAVGILAVSSDQLRATPFLFEDVGDRGLTAGTRLGQRLISSRATDDLVLLWHDPHHIHPRSLLQGLDATLGALPVAGAAAATNPPDGDTFQFSGDESGPAAVSGLRLGGSFRYHAAVSQGCRVSGAPVRVTRAHDNIILEIDGRLAREVVRERVPDIFVPLAVGARKTLFVGSADTDGPTPFRNVVAIDPDTGMLAITSDVEDGQSVTLAVQESGVARSDLDRTLRRAVAESAGVDFRFGLYFNCLARGSNLHDEGGVDTAVISRVLPDLPVLGLFGNAEIAPVAGANRVLMHSGVLVLIGE